MAKSKKEFFWSKWGYTKKDFQRWGRKGGLVFKYSSQAERQRAYRRRKMQARIDAGLVSGVLNMETGRMRKYRNGASRQRAWRERKLNLNYDMNSKYKTDKTNITNWLMRKKKT